MKIYNFISKKNLENHVKKTFLEYQKTLRKVDLKEFCKNLVDPIKLLFDKNFLNKNYKEIIELEIIRQRDKTNNNTIGYFHQNLFNYFTNCEVPSKGWDLIINNYDGKTLFVEIKNKHNTMNSSSAAKTYLKMSQFLIENKTKDYACALVEIISKESQNIPWKLHIDGEEFSSESIRKISVDKLYYEITGYKNAFRDLCFEIENIINDILTVETSKTIKESDTVFQELKEQDENIYKALLKITFSKYEGFK